MSYWQDRMAASQDAITKKNVKEIEKQQRKYYERTMKRTIADFEATYDKLLATVAADKTPTPADLYKLDRYWQLQAQSRRELEKLGEREITLLSKNFEKQWHDIYNSISLPSAAHYSTLDEGAVKQMISEIWVADGKSYSQRIWGNTQDLIDMLNDELINCVATGRRTTELKHALQEKFNVSYNRANSLVRTEMAHIQTQAARQRYKDYGIEKIQVWADKDERRCDVCGKLHKKEYNINEPVPIPAHPNCRCCVIPLVEI